MNNPRRAFLAAIPALMASGALAAENAYLPSKIYEFSQLPVHHGKTNTYRPVLDGVTHENCRIEVHESDLAPGNMPHPPHHHRHEEMFLVREGTLDFTINGKSSEAGPGSVVFIASNDVHGVRNVGDNHALYFVLAIHRPGDKES
ncbi:MAG: cupin domain-containing protein [Acidobacteria bacterium]|nr:cupin domain-containing protein [Acidobacteriota bacterium]